MLEGVLIIVGGVMMTAVLRWGSSRETSTVVLDKVIWCFAVLFVVSVTVVLVT